MPDTTNKKGIKYKIFFILLSTISENIFKRIKQVRIIEYKRKLFFQSVEKIFELKL